jgi:hypothetical protein
VTTVTPSDRAGTASAKRSAPIPAQRSGQALRLLVLGTGEGAAAFRERAAAAGAELAQRYSVRVTHVVAEDGIGEKDARVVKARAAGLPVLDLSAGARLIEEQGTTTVPATAETVAIADAEPESAPEPEPEAEPEPEPTVEVRAEAEADVQVDVEAEAEETEPEPEPEVLQPVQVVRPRTETVPEPVALTPIELAPAEPAPLEVGPSDVFTESALEAVLFFPPLAPEDTSVSVLEEATAGACGCGTDDIDLGETDSADEDDDEGGVTVVEPDVDRGRDLHAADEAVTATATASAASHATQAARTTASIAWALVPLVSLGLLTPVAMGYAARRVRSRGLWIATAVYSAAVVAAFAVSAAVPLRTGAHAEVGYLLTGCFAASWLGGTVHGLLVRRRVFD